MTTLVYNLSTEKFIIVLSVGEKECKPVHITFCNSTLLKMLKNTDVNLQVVEDGVIRPSTKE